MFAPSAITVQPFFSRVSASPPSISFCVAEGKAASQAMKARRGQGETIGPAEYHQIGQLFRRAEELYLQAGIKESAAQMAKNALSFFMAGAGSSQPSSSSKPAKLPTFAQARSALLDALRAAGWTVNASLKVPHATSPQGHVRLWFKPQAVYAAAGSTNMADAHSYESDIRTLDPAKFALQVEVDVLSVKDRYH